MSAPHVYANFVASMDGVVALGLGESPYAGCVYGATA
jgi:hypothetical protein